MNWALLIPLALVAWLIIERLDRIGRVLDAILDQLLKQNRPDLFTDDD